jgi:transcriptional regulator with XRE-family HTH domain
VKNQSNEALKIFGSTLRAIRTIRGLSQEEFAHICCLDRTYISGLELGKRNPTLRVLTSMADQLNISVSELVSGIGNKGKDIDKN